MIGVSIGIAICKVLKSKDLRDETVGEIIFQIQESLIDKKSWFSQKFMKIMYTGPIGKWYLKRLAKKSHKSPYEYDIEFDYIDGDGKDLLFGFNFTKCGLVDFYKDHGAENFAPFICLTDYAIANKLGVGFKRTKTLAMGAESCDHRYYKNTEFIKGWDLENFDDYRVWKQMKVID